MPSAAMPFPKLYAGHFRESLFYCGVWEFFGLFFLVRLSLDLFW